VNMIPEVRKVDCKKKPEEELSNAKSKFEKNCLSIISTCHFAIFERLGCTLQNSSPVCIFVVKVYKLQTAKRIAESDM